MNIQDKRNSVKLQASAYGVAFLMMMIVGCDNLSNTDQSEIGQDDFSTTSVDLSASFDYNCSNSATCTFTDTSTGDEIVSRVWDPAGIADNGKHTFKPGERTVTLTITDGNGNSASASETINCRSSPKHGVQCS